MTAALAPETIAPADAEHIEFARAVVARTQSQHTADSIDVLGFRATGIVRNHLGLGPREARALVSRAISDAGFGSY